MPQQGGSWQEAWKADIQPQAVSSSNPDDAMWPGFNCAVALAVKEALLIYLRAEQKEDPEYFLLRPSHTGREPLLLFYTMGDLRKKSTNNLLG